VKKPDKISTEQKNLMINLGKRIKQLRKDQKKSYEVLAKEMGVPRNTYYNIEAGRLNFQFSSLCQILLYYKRQHNITPEEIFKDI
jgi:transcriptional regulator with XRE-family HTH domain